MLSGKAEWADLMLSDCISQLRLPGIADWQLWVQERPEAVPTGELPQSMTLIVDRHLVGKISPGTRITAVGIYSIYQVIFPAYACPMLSLRLICKPWTALKCTLAIPLSVDDIRAQGPHSLTQERACYLP